MGLLIIRLLLVFMLAAAPLCLINAVAGPPSCIEMERRALLHIKAGLHRPDGWLSSWSDDDRDCCRWRGVGCNNATGHVVKLNLRHPGSYDVWVEIDYDAYVYSRTQLAPSKLNPSLGELTHLQHLDLSMNNFNYTPIPEFIGSLVQLTHLNLSHTQFGGSVPHHLGNLSRLRFLDLQQVTEIEYYSFYDLSTFKYPVSSGNLNWLSRMSSLQYVDLSGVDLSLATNWLQQLNMLPRLSVLLLQFTRLHSIPAFLPHHLNLTSLTTLDLSGNSFVLTTNAATTIPYWLFNVTSLQHLYLRRCGLDGELPESLGNLQKLQTLDLSENSITGSIPPDTIGNMTSLKEIDLYLNSITGSIPDTLGNMNNLKYLDLSGNRITGSIPDTLGNMTNLEYLILFNNSITGSIPDTLGNMTNLTDLYLSYNRITGEIPKSIGGLSKLERMDLSSNQIRGNIPNTIGNLSLLEFLFIYDNMINGEIPYTIGNLSSLQDLDLSNNSISGEIPLSMGKLCNLNDLRLSNNNIGEEITWFIDALSKCTQNNPLTNTSKDTDGGYDRIGLSRLDLSNNKFKGRVPLSLGHLYKLQHLILHSNSLSGAFPEASQLPLLSVLLLNSNNFIGPMPKLGPSINIVDLSNNSFSGPIPRDLGAVGLGLQMLSISDNHFNGNIPPSICKFYNLEVLHLSNNNLSGRFPECKNKLVKPTDLLTKNLQSLNLRNNAITGGFPSVLKQCENLTTLDLSGNELSGEIPTWIGEYMKSLQIIILRSNNFSGTVPPQLSSLIFLKVLDLSHNSLSGNLPHSFWSFTAMSTVDINISKPTRGNNISQYYSESIIVITKGIKIEYTKLLTMVTSVDISANNFSGEIPEGLVNLYGLRSLNMSNNHFRGKLPNEIGNLLQLESLDLSENNLSGHIPTSISAIYSLSHLNLSNNNFSGSIPSGNQLQTLVDPSIYKGNFYLCGWPLPPCPVGETPSQQLLHTSDDDEKERNENRLEMIWICVSSIVGFIMGFWWLIITMVLKPAIRIAYFQSFDRVCDWCYVKLAVNFNRLRSIATKTD